MKKISILMLVAALMFSLVLTGCQKSDNETNGNAVNNEETKSNTEAGGSDGMDEVQEYTFVHGSEVTTLDPHKVGSIPVWGAQAPLYENLTRYIQTEDGEAKIVPGMAKTWSVSDDGLVWTFNLREDAKWSDGSALNAHDFVYSWQRVFDPEVASDYEWMVDAMIKGGSEFNQGTGTREEVGVTALDDYTLQIELKMKVTLFDQIAAFPTYKPVKKSAIEEFGEEYGSSVDKVVTNGPFMVSEWSPGVELVYVPNPHYWDKENVHLTKITRQIVKEEAPRAQALISGQVDSAGIGEPEWLTMIDETGKFEYINRAGASVDFFMYQTENPFLKNKKIRQALSMAFDRTRYVEECFDGFGIGAYSIVPTTMHAGSELYYDITKGENKVVETLINNTPDPKALLIEGLVEEGFAADPSVVELSLMTRGTGDKSKTSAEWLKQHYKETLGIDITIQLTEWNVMWTNVTSGDYDIAIGGWTADLDDPSNLIDIFHTDPSTGYYHGGKTGWSGDKADEFDALVDKAIQTTDSHEKALIYLEAEKILLDEAIISPQYFGETSSYRGKYVKGLFTNSFTFVDYKGVFLEGKK